MPTPRLLCLALLLLAPLAVRAEDVDVPELGVRLTSLPSGAVKPEVIAQPGGYQLTTGVGAAVFSVYRDDAPAPAGSDVASPAYRASLDARFNKSIDSRSQGAPTSLAGHSAWTVVDAQREDSAHTLYVCVTYVIVDEHLYRLTVTAHGSGARPAEFDSLVRTMSDITFEPIRRGPPPAAAG
jgi:hypothetical protein